MMQWMITRPSPHGEQLVAELQQQQIPAIHLPLYQIAAGRELPQLATKLQQLKNDDLLIAVSPQVIYQLATQSITFPNWLHYFAVGQTTAKLLQQHIGQPVIAPQPQNSEGLLALPQLQQVANRRVLILRGNHGRTLLGESLTQRGALVSYCECYQRLNIAYPADLSQNWPPQTGIVVTSLQSLQLLQHYISPIQRQHWLLLVNSQRIASHAKQAGWQSVILVNSGECTNFVKSIVALCNNRQQNRL